MSPPQASGTAAECPATVDQLRQQAHQRLDALLDFCTAGLPGCFLDFERALLPRLLGLGGLLLQLFLLACHLRLDLAPWRRGGYRLADGYAGRTLQTSCGAVTFGRAYLAPRRGKGAGVHPLAAAFWQQPPPWGWGGIATAPCSSATSAAWLLG